MCLLSFYPFVSHQNAFRGKTGNKDPNGLQVFFPKNNFLHSKELLNEFFITCSKEYLNFPQCITCFLLLIIE